MSSTSSVASNGSARAPAAVDDAPRSGATIHQKQRQGVQIYLEGSGRARMGDISFNENHNYHDGAPATQTPEDKKTALIESLRFETMDSRSLGIRTQCANTCGWLLETAEWRGWQQSINNKSHPRLLWIKGKAGTGKSTLMKFATRTVAEGYRQSWNGPLERMSSWVRRFEPRDGTVLAHFFNARATEELQKSSEGMYRTILNQILGHLSARSICELIATWPSLKTIRWDLNRLTNLFEAAVKEHNKQTGRSVTCFIDALDECEEKQAIQMISSFSHLLNRSEAEGTRLRVCFASRHYSTLIAPRKSVVLIIEEQPGHASDINTYIEASLHMQDDTIHETAKALLKSKAQGTFIWCVLVIDMINERYSEGKLDRNPASLEAIIDSIPTKLHDLFGTILGVGQSNSIERLCGEETVLCFQWVLLARRSISPDELWWGIHRGSEPLATTHELTEKYRQTDIDRYILQISKGLTEIVTTHTDPPQAVQFIHESVRDYFLKKGVLAQLMGLDNAHQAQAEAQAHERLKILCWEETFQHGAQNFDTLISVRRLAWGDEGVRDLEELSSLADRSPKAQVVLRRYPAYNFLRYAVENMVKHANAAQEGTEFDQACFLEDLERNREQWLDIATHLELLYHWSWAQRLIHLLLLHDADALILVHYHQHYKASLRSLDFGENNTAFGIARSLEQGNFKAIRAVVEIEVDRHRNHLRTGRRHHLQTLANEIVYQINEPPRSESRYPPGANEGWWLIDLVYYNDGIAKFFLLASLPVTDEAERLLANMPETAIADFASLVEFILRTPDHLNASLVLDLNVTLGWAAGQGLVAISEMILGQPDVSVNYSGPFGLTALHLAAQRGHEAILRLLMDRADINLNASKPKHFTALLWACEFRQENSVRILTADNRVNLPPKTSRAWNLGVRGNNIHIRRLLRAAKKAGRQVEIE